MFNANPLPVVTVSAIAPARPPAAIVANIPQVVLSGLLRMLEVSVLAGLGVLLALAYVDGAASVLNLYAFAAMATAVLAGVVFEMMGLYHVPAMRHRARMLPRAIAGWSIAIAALAAAVFFLKLGTAYSRVWLAAWYVAGVLALTLSRFAAGSLVKAWSNAGHLTRRAVIYGHGAPCQELIEALARDGDKSIRICGIFDDRANLRGREAGSEAVAAGRMDDLIAFARTSKIDLVLVALPFSAEMRLLGLLQHLLVLPADIRLLASASRLRLAPRACARVGSVALIPLADKPIADWGIVAKWAFDKVIGAAALIMLSPVMLATALAIKLDSKGPVFFRQKRYGFNNELIEVYKFRSMYVDQADAAAARLVTKDDPRVTRVGRVIRKTSLDELPQLFNVMLGTLALVGPRPHAVSAKAAGILYDEAVDSYFARHRVKPGITGWAQINGWRGETDTQEKLRHRVEHDLYYIENWSVLFDAYVLLNTPFALLKTENAY